METEDEKVTISDYLNEKFGGEGADSEIAGYLADKFNELPLPGNNKRKLTIQEMLKKAQEKI